MDKIKSIGRILFLRWIDSTLWPLDPLDPLYPLYPLSRTVSSHFWSLISRRINFSHLQKASLSISWGRFALCTPVINNTHDLYCTSSSVVIVVVITKKVTENESPGDRWGSGRPELRVHQTIKGRRHPTATVKTDGGDGGIVDITHSPSPRTPCQINDPFIHTLLH